MPDTEKDDTEKEPTMKPFAAWLTEQRGGTTHAELTAALPEVVEAVTTYGKPGELILRVKIKPADGDRGAVIVADDVIVKKPAGDRAPAMFFVDGDHNLTRDNPFNEPLPKLREVPPVPGTGDGSQSAKEA